LRYNVDSFPERNNFYGAIETALNKSELAAVFAASGWSIRKCTWEDYELTCGFAELILEADDPMLLHGAVAEVLQNAQGVADVLRKAGATFSLECYATDHTLVAKICE
jgi:hypothetical protein